jgi:hypothetical protein
MAAQRPAVRLPNWQLSFACEGKLQLSRADDPLDRNFPPNPEESCTAALTAWKRAAPAFAFSNTV